jgi:tetratricopeptide (TPR) repeat protein
MQRKGVILWSVLFLAFAVLCITGCGEETTAKEYYQKSFQFINAGSIQDAIDLLTLAIGKDPSFFEAYYNRGVMYYCQEKYQKALDDFDKAISLDSKHAGAYASRGTVYDKLNMPEKSMVDLKTAARLGDKETQDYLKSKEIAW